jgi:hypothetical protein
MTTYRRIFAVREFRGVFFAEATTTAGRTMEMLALSVLVYATTGSALLAALAYLAGFLPQALGAMSLLSLADRLPPRAFLVLWDGVRIVVPLALASRALPVWGMILLVMAFGIADPVAGAARTALLVEVLPTGAYVLGRSALNISVGIMQIVGYGIGGSVLALIGAVPALLVSAALAAVSGAVQWFLLSSRPARSAEGTAISATWHGNRRLLTDQAIRVLLLAQWLPNGLIVGAEALFVPYLPGAAGALFTAAAGGMLIGDLIVGRWMSRDLRQRLVIPLYLLLAVPYLAFLVHPGPWVAAATVAIASFGYAAHLGLQERSIETVPETLRGHSLGLAASGMLTMQAVAAMLAGSLADLWDPGTAMAAAGAASLLITMGLARGLRRPVPAPAGEPAAR